MSSKPVILFDVTRLAIRVTLTSPTGIDRITEAYAAWLLSRDDLEIVPVCSWGGVLWPMPRRTLEAMLARKTARLAPSDDTWRRLHAALSGANGGPALRAQPNSGGKLRASVRRYLPAALRTVVNWRPQSIPGGATYLNVSHFGLEQPRVLDRLAARGIKSMAMVHDLIPIEHPEFCSPHAAVLHKRRVEALLRHASLIIANSQATADACSRYAEATSARCPPVCVAPLGLEASFLAASELEPPPSPGFEQPYFVCVGTLEPRKNLTFLLTLWRRLAERLGEHTPPLVLVGQRGWENEAIIDQLERAPAVLRHVHEAAGLDDRQLAQLISGARALLAPSFTEGFNLPVAEAIALGTPVIASDIAVHRELAAGARLIDPVDGPAWLEAMEQAASARPAPGPVRRPGWTEHFERVAIAMGLQPASKLHAACGVPDLDETDHRLPRDTSCSTNA